jgi:hypothetical protein
MAGSGAISDRLSYYTLGWWLACRHREEAGQSWEHPGVVDIDRDSVEHTGVSGSPLSNGASPRAQSGGVSSVELAVPDESGKPYPLRFRRERINVGKAIVRLHVTNVNS